MRPRLIPTGFLIFNYIYIANTELRREIFATMMISRTSQKFLAREINIGLQNKDLKIGEQSWQERNEILIKKNQVDLEKKKY